MKKLLSVLLVVCCLVSGEAVCAENIKPLPPPGIEIDSKQREALGSRVTTLNKEINLEAANTRGSSRWIADLLVFTRAIELALSQNTFYSKSDVANATKLLDVAERRLALVRSGIRGLTLLGLSESTLDKPQLLVGGFVSKIDDSVQPYGLVIPAGFRAGEAKKYRLDLWLHGRGDNQLEIAFLTERLKSPGIYTPENTIVLHPFGRHCNAFKFAGETDVFESMEHVQAILPIDKNRIAMRGFSMGGAGAWHLGVHAPGRWFAVNPGAGFIDSIVYQNWDKNPPFEIDAVHQKLLRWYDVLPWVTNLRNTKAIAYSGEVDRQKEAADRVVAAARENEVLIEQIVGANMGHKIDDASRDLIDKRMAEFADEEIVSPRPSIDFTTYTTRYSQVDWLNVTGLKEHWEAGHVTARISGENRLIVKTEGITHLEFDFKDSGWPKTQSDVDLIIDGGRFTVPDISDTMGWQCRLVRTQGEDWNLDIGDPQMQRKRPGLQGPIDDAFSDRFLFVLPTRPAIHGEAERWIKSEQEYAQKRWRELMRGNVRAVKDIDLTDDDIEKNHLVCFGDFFSNHYLSKIRDSLPIEWTKDTLKVGKAEFNPATHVAAFCYPNPQNPKKYVVLNSGMTFRDFSNVSNSRQIAMLPDWAVLNTQTDDQSIFSGRVVAKGFFDERWNVR